MPTELAEQKRREIGPVRTEVTSEIGQLIQIAIEKDLDVEKLDKLLQMKREHDERERLLTARDAYLESKAAFLAECPVIKADKQGGGGGGPKWNYATLGRILAVALPIMGKHGLSYSSVPDFKSGLLTCTLKHVLGHEESAVFPLTIDGQNEKATASLTLQQKWAHALTFAERQAFKAVSGVPTDDKDVDALTPQVTNEHVEHAKAANDIKREWARHRHELEGKPQDEVRRRFAAWFLDHTDATRFTPIVAQWSPEQIKACQQQLDKEAKARELSKPTDTTEGA